MDDKQSGRCGWHGAAAVGLIALSLVACTSACTSLAPRYERPASPVDDRYGAEAVERAGQVLPADLADWRAYFKDPTLQALIEAALAHNRDVQLAALRVEEARHALGLQASYRWPSVSIDADMARARTPADLNLTQRPLLGSQYEIGLAQAAWEIDLWGRVRSLTDAARASYLAADSTRQAAALAVMVQVAQTYLMQCELEERLALAQRTLSSRETSYRIFSRRVAVGSTSRLDLMQVETLLTQAQLMVAQLEQAVASNRHALSLLVGAPTALAVSPSRVEAIDLPALAPGMPSELLTRRPDIVAAEHRLQAAHANIGAARAAFFPRVALTSNFNTASAALSGLFDAGSEKWQFVPFISLPIFDGGRNASNLSLAEVRKEMAVADYERTVQSAFRDVLDALSASQWVSRQVDVQTQAAKAQAERARLAQLRYDHGATTFLEVLDAQRDLLTLEQSVVQLMRQQRAAQVSLFAALGGVPAVASSSCETCP